MVLSPKAKSPTLQGFSDTTSPAFRQNCSKSGTHSIWLRGPDLNRRPSGYEGVSAKISWTDCRKLHRMDGISAYPIPFQPVLSNWCFGVFPVVGQNMGQAAMWKTQGVPAAYHHSSLLLPATPSTSLRSPLQQNTVP